MTPPPAGFAFADPDRMAELEIAAWKAYYAHRWTRLGKNLWRLLREQFGLSSLAALGVAWHFGLAAARFRRSLGRERVDVTPALARGYAIIRRARGAAFDPVAAARAELAWWEARRDSARSDPTIVGALMAELYALLLERDNEELRRAARLRAEAAWLRDQNEAAPDWPRVAALLRESHQALHRAARA